MIWLGFCCLLLGKIAGDGSMEGPPRWNSQFPDHITLRGTFAEVRLDCDADGTPAPSVEWLKNGNSIQVEQNQEIHMLKSGSLLMTNVDDAMYTCIAKNKHGQLTRKYTIHSFRAPPLIVQPPRNTSAVVGETVRFHCRYMSDLRAHQQWLKHNKVNGSFVDEDDNPHLDVIKTADPEVLVLDNVTEKDESWYTCLAGNKFGISHKSAWLTVIQAANVTKVIEPEASHWSLVLAIGCSVGGFCLLLSIALAGICFLRCPKGPSDEATTVAYTTVTEQLISM